MPQQKKAHVREAILLAARQQLAEHGLAGAALAATGIQAASKRRQINVRFMATVGSAQGSMAIQFTCPPAGSVGASHFRSSASSKSSR
jgi:hypothetical protein